MAYRSDLANKRIRIKVYFVDKMSRQLFTSFIIFIMQLNNHVKRMTTVVK